MITNGNRDGPTGSTETDLKPPGGGVGLRVLFHVTPCQVDIIVHHPFSSVPQVTPQLECGAAVTKIGNRKMMPDPIRKYMDITFGKFTGPFTVARKLLLPRSGVQSPPRLGTEDGNLLVQVGEVFVSNLKPGFNSPLGCQGEWYMPGPVGLGNLRPYQLKKALRCRR